MFTILFYLKIVAKYSNLSYTSEEKAAEALATMGFKPIANSDKFTDGETKAKIINLKDLNNGTI